MTPQQYGANYQDHFLEQYKLCVEMAEAASQRRDQINRYYPTLFSVLAAILVILTRVDLSEELALSADPTTWILVGFGIMGIYLVLTWSLSISSYQRFISIKYGIIREMEEHLPFPANRKEAEQLPPSVMAGYRELLLPMAFILPFYGVMVYAFVLLVNSQ